MDKLRIGVHTSISGGVQNAVKSEKQKTGNCGQLFSHSPRSWSKPEISEEEVKCFNKLREKNDIGPWVIHSSYLVNLCTPKEDLRQKSKESLQYDLDAAEKLGIEYVNVHFGAHTGAGVEKGLENATEVIESVKVPDNVDLVIETDSGSGTNLGHTFDQLQTVQISTDTEIGFCVDTAHIWAAGYDISTAESTYDVFDEFDQKIGLENLSIVHLNDTDYELGSYRDEHQHLGEGKIGYEGLKKVVNIAGNNDVPIIAETPITERKNDRDNLRTAREMWNN